MNLHPQVVALLEQARAAGVQPFDELTVAQARAASASVVEIIVPGAEVGVREVAVPVDGAEIAARVYEPDGPPGALVVYFHGGGWVVGGLDYVDALCRNLCAQSGARVVSVDYRMAPEHPYPTPVRDAEAALRWAAAELAAGPLVVAGDSAGGNLATVVARRAADLGLALQVLVYPVCDHDTQTASYVAFGTSPPMLTTGEMCWFWDLYAPLERRGEPDASPLRAPGLEALPPSLVLLAANDPLHDEGAAYAMRLREAGVPVELVTFGDQIHSFFPLQGVLDGADGALSLVAARVRSAAGAAS